MRRLGRLRQLREASFMSQQELALKSGVSRVAITRLEGGDVEAQYGTIRKLAEALGVGPSELLTPDESKSKTAA